MSDHRDILKQFLQRDLYRLEAGLEGKEWTAEAAERLTYHLRYAAQVQYVLLEGSDPRDESLSERLDRIRPASMEEVLEGLVARTESLIQGIQQSSDERLDAPVLDPNERGFSVLGHLYDFCRTNAMLVEWAHTLPAVHRPNPDFAGSDW